MEHVFLGCPESMWNVIFLVVRYVAVALVLAYLTHVVVKRGNIRTSLKGRKIEMEVEIYKNLYRWLMDFQKVIAPPLQAERKYEYFISHTGFEIGYQGMEYAAFFDEPIRIIQLNKKLEEVLKNDGPFVDKSLRKALQDFHEWLDDVVFCLRNFIHTENDEQWGLTDDEKQRNILFACRMTGIALQKDVNTYFNLLEGKVRNRLRLHGDSVFGHGCSYYKRSQLQKEAFSLIVLFFFAHYERDFVEDAPWIKDEAQFTAKLEEYSKCYESNLEK